MRQILYRLAWGLCSCLLTVSMLMAVKPYIPVDTPADHHAPIVTVPEEPTVQQPELPEKRPEQYTLPELELHCRKLDLFFSFSKAFGCTIDRDALYDEREEVADRINTILLHNLKNNIRFCAQCGAALPLHHNGRLCNACFQKRNQRRW